MSKTDEIVAALKANPLTPDSELVKQFNVSRQLVSDCRKQAGVDSLPRNHKALSIVAWLEAGEYGTDKETAELLGVDPLTVCRIRNKLRLPPHVVSLRSRIAAYLETTDYGTDKHTAALFNVSQQYVCKIRRSLELPPKG